MYFSFFCKRSKTGARAGYLISSEFYALCTREINFCKGKKLKFFLNFSGSVFLERDLLIHQAFGQIRDEINLDENYLNGTRLDYNIQYSDIDQFDAYQKACMEMTYR